MDDGQTLTTDVLHRTAEGRAWRVIFTWAVLGGRMECIGLSVKPWRKPHRLKVSEWRSCITLVESQRKVAQQLVATAARQPGLQPGQRVAAQRAAAAFTTRPRQQYDAAHYEEVARIYSDAVRVGRRDPSNAVAEQLGGSSDQARKWVQECRRRGLLPPAAGQRKVGPPAPARRGRKR